LGSEPSEKLHISYTPSLKGWDLLLSLYGKWGMGHLEQKQEDAAPAQSAES